MEAHSIAPVLFNIIHTCRHRAPRRQLSFLIIYFTLAYAKRMPSQHSAPSLCFLYQSPRRHLSFLIIHTYAKPGPSWCFLYKSPRRQTRLRLANAILHNCRRFGITWRNDEHTFTLTCITLGFDTTFRRHLTPNMHYIRFQPNMHNLRFILNLTCIRTRCFDYFPRCLLQGVSTTPSGYFVRLTGHGQPITTHVLIHPYQFIIQASSYHSMLQNL